MLCPRDVIDYYGVKNRAVTMSPGIGKGGRVELNIVASSLVIFGSGKAVLFFSSIQDTIRRRGRMSTS